MQRALGLAALAAIASAVPVQIRGPPGNKGESLICPVFSFTSFVSLRGNCANVSVELG